MGSVPNGTIGLGLHCSHTQVESYDDFMQKYGKTLSAEIMQWLYAKTKENEDGYYHFNFQFFATDASGNLSQPLPTCGSCKQLLNR